MHSKRRGGSTLILTLALAAPLTADTYEVDVFTDNPLADECTPAPGDCSLRGAVITANANPGQDRIELPAGLFAMTLAGPDDAAMVGDLDLAEAVIIEGAGPGLTVLDGELLFDRFFTANAAVELRDLTLTGAASPGSGGALLIAIGGSALLERVEVLVNHTEFGGGGIFALGDVTLRDSLVAGNHAETPGGGLVMGVDAVLTLEDSRVRGNSTADNLGGGIFAADASSVLMMRSSVEINRTGVTPPLAGGMGEQGAGVYLDADTLGVFIDSSFLGNVTSGPASAGGGLRVLGQANFLGCTVAWNRAEVGAGVSVGDGGVVVTINTTLGANSWPTPLTGSFAVESGGNAALRATTIRALPGDRAVLVVGGNVIVEDSAFDGGCRFLAGATVPSIGGNVSAPTACWTQTDPDLDDEVVADLMLSGMGRFGGPTLTHLPLPGSPLLGHALGACQEVDQRGETRTDCDSGAVERQGGDPTPVFVDTFEGGSTEAWNLVVGGPEE